MTRSSTRTLCLLLVALAALPLPARGDDHALHTFKRIGLTDVYFSEGAAAGDIDNDGHMDAVYGPYWFKGPDFQQKHEIYAPKPQPTERYADHFFAWVYDFNGDGFPDVFTVGFPGTPAFVYENPKSTAAGHWKKHQVFDWVSNESPYFGDIVGDERPELVCTRAGHFGYATIDWEKPFEPWTFHPISEQIATMRFGHGLGVGDVNGDGRMDVIHAAGWFEQPASLDGDAKWTSHKAPLSTAYGGAEMHAYDVDGDGDNDIITSLAAHEFGLAWYEQVRGEDGAIAFRRHLIMGDKPEHNRFGLVFSELHSVALADIDGDGLKDIVTGKTYWSHHRQSPMWDAGAVVYWFRLTRTPDGVVWVPHRADDDSGIGRQVGVFDLNKDGLPDIIAGGMKGGHVLIHSRKAVDEKTWREAQPKVFDPASANAAFNRGDASPIDDATGKVAGAVEGESIKVLEASGGRTTVQPMAGFKKDRWSGDAQLFWLEAKPGDKLTVELPVPASGTYELAAALTMARDYGIVQLHLDDKPLGKPLDLYSYPDVVTTGVLKLGRHELKEGNHKLTFEITGANPAAVKAYMVGIDYVRLIK
jgi:hypothetical protein